MHATIFLQSGEVLKLHYLEETVNKDKGSRFLMELVSKSLGSATTISLPQLHNSTSLKCGEWVVYAERVTFDNKEIVCMQRQGFIS